MLSGSCQHYRGNGDGFRFFAGRCYQGAVQSGWSYRGCACRSCRSYLEILGSHQGIFCRGVQRDYGRLTPLRETFERFGPVFDAIGSGISQVFNWFKSLLSPMESSKETLDKCTSAGEIFGNVLGGALQLVLTPAKMLLDTLAWMLEKLGVLPDEAERARKKIEDAQRAAILQDKVALLQGTWRKSIRRSLWKMAMAPEVINPKTTNRSQNSNTGTLRRLSKIADNTGKLVDETKKRIGPGDIVFKNLPRALAVRGEWQERKITQVSKPAPAINITPVVPAPLPPALVPVVAASSHPVAEAIPIASGISSCRFP